MPRGSTLIELLISLTLSLILLGLVSVIYLATERQNALLNDLVRLHDNSRFVLQRLELELQMAGFIGCPRLSHDFMVWNASGVSLTPANKVELQPDELGSTAVTVRHRSLKSVVLLEPTTASPVLLLAAGLQAVAGDRLLISDCQHAELFQVAEARTQSGGQRLTALNPLRYHYAENAEIGIFETRTYSLEKTGRKNQAGREITALYMTEQSGHKSELADGIQKLKIETDASGQGFAIELQAVQKGLSKTEYAFVTLRN